MSDNISELPADQRGNGGADDNLTINTRLSQCCYVFVCMNLPLLGYLASAHPTIYYIATKEDSWIENLTAVGFLLSCIALFAAALAERRLFPDGHIFPAAQ